MPDLSRYLRRFRRQVSPPGRPGPAAVPSDRRAELSDELADVFTAIDEVAQEADRIRRDGEKTAERRRREAEEAAERILARAREATDEIRSEEAARRRGEIDDDIEAARAEAAQDADAICTRSEERLDDLADRIVDLVSSIDVQETG